MALVATEYRHVLVDEKGVAVIAGTTMKVVELVSHHLTYGWSPEELHFQFPHISLGKVYSALAYYWDFKDSLDADMERRWQQVEAWRSQDGESPVIAELRMKGLFS